MTDPAEKLHAAKVEIARKIHYALSDAAEFVRHKIYSHCPNEGQSYIDIEVEGHGDWRIVLEEKNS